MKTTRKALQSTDRKKNLGLIKQNKKCILSNKQPAMSLIILMIAQPQLKIIIP